jgi:glycosyltransferase involved in cell wall biosynthesis
MSDRPLVSVIIPCYKQAEYLAGAIDSALAQTYSPVEVVVVNDGSPDDTEKVALSYGDAIVYVGRANGGLSAARNSGIACAKGRFLKFLDADDHLHPE